MMIPHAIETMLSAARGVSQRRLRGWSWAWGITEGEDILASERQQTAEAQSGEGDEAAHASIRPELG
jgi:hypothetical protein